MLIRAALSFIGRTWDFHFAHFNTGLLPRAGTHQYLNHQMSNFHSVSLVCFSVRLLPLLDLLTWLVYSGSLIWLAVLRVESYLLACLEWLQDSCASQYPESFALINLFNKCALFPARAPGSFSVIVPKHKRNPGFCVHGHPDWFDFGGTDLTVKKGDATC